MTIQFLPHTEPKSVTTTNTSWSLLLKEIITIECESDMKHKSTLWGKYNRVLNVAEEGNYGYHNALGN
jgi:hypothetical protein